VDRLNRSRILGSLIEFFATRLARYRGIPILLGVVLTVVSFIIHIIAVLTGYTGWYVAAFTVLHLAIFSGLLGILLAEPLGRG